MADWSFSSRGAGQLVVGTMSIYEENTVTIICTNVVYISLRAIVQ